jgi:hypothetical protein
LRRIISLPVPLVPAPAMSVAAADRRRPARDEIVPRPRTSAELLNGPMNREWCTASFTDPDGHNWEVAQELPDAEGS